MTSPEVKPFTARFATSSIPGTRCTSWSGQRSVAETDVPIVYESPSATYRSESRATARSALVVRPAVRGGRADPAHEAGDDDDRHQVRDHQQDLRRNRHVEDRQARLERVGEAEDEAREERPDRRPGTEDHGGEADEAAAAGHVLHERAGRAGRGISA